MANYVVVTSNKDKNLCLWLCILGGYIGLHQFYVGKYGKGLLYLLTGGLFVFGWIIDIISIASGSFTDNSGAPLRATKKELENQNNNN